MPYDTGPLATDATPAPKPGFFGGLLNTLFPATGYGALIDPEQVRAEQQMALRKAGLTILAGAGPRPYGTRNLPADIANALNPDDWQHRLAAVAEQSATIGAMQKKAALEAKAQAILAQFPPVPGETDQERDQRLSRLADAYQAAGLMEYAKATGDLRSSLRAPALTEHDGVLRDHWGNIVGTAPGADTGVEGSILYNTAKQRLAQFDPIHKAILVLNRARVAPPVKGNRLSPDVSVALTDAANAILGSHGALSQDEENPMTALAHAHSAGDLGKFLAAILSQGGGTMTVAQRDQLLKLIDPVLSDLGAEQTRVKNDIQRIFNNRWKKNPAMAQSMYDQLPVYEDFGPGGHVSDSGVSTNRLKQMNADLGRQ